MVATSLWSFAAFLVPPFTAPRRALAPDSIWGLGVPCRVLALTAATPLPGRRAVADRRYYKYGTPLFNYGMLPQTWEDPSECGGLDGACGDDDPLDVIEVGAAPLAMGAVTAVKVLGVLELIDEGETDYKVAELSPKLGPKRLPPLCCLPFEAPAPPGTSAGRAANALHL